MIKFINKNSFLDPGVDLDDTAESSLRPLLFIDGFENAVVSGVKTGEKVCVKVNLSLKRIHEKLILIIFNNIFTYSYVLK